MRSKSRLLMFLVILVMCLGMAPALADSPSEEECEAQNGTFDRTRGTVTCTILDPVGQSEHSGGRSQATEEEESSQGTLDNRPHHEESCTGPGGSGEGGGPCKKK